MAAEYHESFETGEGYAKRVSMQEKAAFNEADLHKEHVHVDSVHASAAGHGLGHSEAGTIDYAIRPTTADQSPDE